MIRDDNDGQMIFGDLKVPDICLTGEEKPRKKILTKETCPDRGSNPGPLRDKRACYHLLHSGGLSILEWKDINLLFTQAYRHLCFLYSVATTFRLEN